MIAVGYMLALTAYLALIGADWQTNAVPSVIRGAAFVMLTEAFIAGCAIIAWQAIA